MTLSDLLRIYGDVTLTQYGGVNTTGRQTEVRFVFDHPAECLECKGGGRELRWHPSFTCPVCHGSGLALELGGES